MSDLLRKYLLTTAAFATDAALAAAPDEKGDDEGKAAGGDEGDTAGDAAADGGDAGDADGDKGEDADGALAAAEAAAAAEETAKQAKKVPWFQKRMNEQSTVIRTKEREAAESRAALERANAELAQLRAQVLGEEGDKAKAGLPSMTPAQIEAEIERRSEAKAVQKVAAKMATDRLTEESDRVYDEGAKKYGAEKMDKAASAYHPDNGGMGLREDFLEVVTELENGYDVFLHYGENQEELEKLYKLSPARLAYRVSKMAEKLAAPPPPPPRKAASNAPAPIKPIAGRGGNTDTSAPADSDDTAAWMRKREADLQRRGVRI